MSQKMGPRRKIVKVDNMKAAKEELVQRQENSMKQYEKIQRAKTSITVKEFNREVKRVVTLTEQQKKEKEEKELSIQPISHQVSQDMPMPIRSSLKQHSRHGSPSRDKENVSIDSSPPRDNNHSAEILNSNRTFNTQANQSLYSEHPGQYPAFQQPKFYQSSTAMNWYPSNQELTIPT